MGEQATVSFDMITEQLPITFCNSRHGRPIIVGERFIFRPEVFNSAVHALGVGAKEGHTRLGMSSGPDHDEGDAGWEERY